MMFQELSKVSKTIRVLVSSLNRTRPFQKEARRPSPPAFSTAFTRGESQFTHIFRRSGLPNRTARFQQSAQEESRNCAAAKIVESTLVILERFRLCPFPKDGEFRCTSATVDHPRNFHW